jgi:hypothetical protein
MKLKIFDFPQRLRPIITLCLGDDSHNSFPTILAIFPKEVGGACLLMKDLPTLRTDSGRTSFNLLR